MLFLCVYIACLIQAASIWGIHDSFFLILEAGISQRNFSNIFSIIYLLYKDYIGALVSEKEKENALGSCSDIST